MGVLLRPAPPLPVRGAQWASPDQLIRWQKPQRASAVATSVFFHIALIVFVLRMPWALLASWLAEPPVPVADWQQNYQVIYPLPARQAVLPFSAKPSRGRWGNRSAEQPQRATHQAGAGLPLPLPAMKLALALKLPHAEPSRQTIIQAGVPPEVRIARDLPLPNVLLAGPANSQALRIPVSGVAAAAPQATRNNPVLPVEQPTIPDVALAVQMPAPAALHLPGPEVALPLASQQPRASGSLAQGPAGEANASGRGLLILGENPAPPGAYLDLPFGNRFGQPALTLSGAGMGAPVGHGSGAVGTGGSSAQPGSAGRAGGGPGAGFGISGDVGNADRGAAALAAFGPAGEGTGGAAAGILPPWLVGQMIFPVTAPIRMPPMSLIVTAGPIGGGGLGVFGVLRGSKIYTVYLPMPGKPWVLQYCEWESHPSSPNRYQQELKLPAGIVPPEVEARFDFHRPPAPPYKQDALIVLHGRINAEGRVEDLTVYQGVLPLADQAALQAFQQWRFRPAKVNGRPIAVEILVGIPYTP